ncbi:hypothetical protein GWN63_04990 [Candidatus Bathyarchaeota archaeon]|nr:hypothetical protein [Candidatus Bathyarchaeota archaeon]
MKDELIEALEEAIEKVQDAENVRGYSLCLMLEDDIVTIHDHVSMVNLLGQLEFQKQSVLADAIGVKK